MGCREAYIRAPGGVAEASRPVPCAPRLTHWAPLASALDHRAGPRLQRGSAGRLRARAPAQLLYLSRRWAMQDAAAEGSDLEHALDNASTEEGSEPEAEGAGDWLYAESSAEVDAGARDGSQAEGTRAEAADALVRALAQAAPRSPSLEPTGDGSVAEVGLTEWRAEDGTDSGQASATEAELVAEGGSDASARGPGAPDAGDAAGAAQQSSGGAVDGFDESSSGSEESERAEEATDSGQASATEAELVAEGGSDASARGPGAPDAGDAAGAAQQSSGGAVDGFDESSSGSEESEDLDESAFDDFVQDDDDSGEDEDEDGEADDIDAKIAHAYAEHMKALSARRAELPPRPGSAVRPQSPTTATRRIRVAEQRAQPRSADLTAFPAAAAEAEARTEFVSTNVHFKQIREEEEFAPPDSPPKAIVKPVGDNDSPHASIPRKRPASAAAGAARRKLVRATPTEQQQDDAQSPRQTQTQPPTPQSQPQLSSDEDLFAPGDDAEGELFSALELENEDCWYEVHPHTAEGPSEDRADESEEIHQRRLAELREMERRVREQIQHQRRLAELREAERRVREQIQLLRQLQGDSQLTEEGENIVTAHATGDVHDDLCDDHAAYTSVSPWPSEDGDEGRSEAAVAAEEAAARAAAAAEEEAAARAAAAAEEEAAARAAAAAEEEAAAAEVRRLEAAERRRAAREAVAAERALAAAEARAAAAEERARDEAKARTRAERAEARLYAARAQRGGFIGWTKAASGQTLSEVQRTALRIAETQATASGTGASSRTAQLPASKFGPGGSSGTAASVGSAPRRRRRLRRTGAASTASTSSRPASMHSRSLDRSDTSAARKALEAARRAPRQPAWMPSSSKPVIVPVEEMSASGRGAPPSSGARRVRRANRRAAHGKGAPVAGTGVTEDGKTSAGLSGPASAFGRAALAPRRPKSAPPRRPRARDARVRPPSAARVHMRGQVTVETVQQRPATPGGTATATPAPAWRQRPATAAGTATATPASAPHASVDPPLDPSDLLAQVMEVNAACRVLGLGERYRVAPGGRRNELVVEVHKRLPRMLGDEEGPGPATVRRARGAGGSGAWSPPPPLRRISVDVFASTHHRLTTHARRAAMKSRATGASVRSSDPSSRRSARTSGGGDDGGGGSADGDAPAHFPPRPSRARSAGAAAAEAVAAAPIVVPSVPLEPAAQLVPAGQQLVAA